MPFLPLSSSTPPVARPFCRGGARRAPARGGSDRRRRRGEDPCGRAAEGRYPRLSMCSDRYGGGSRPPTGTPRRSGQSRGRRPSRRSPARRGRKRCPVRDRRRAGGRGPCGCSGEASSLSSRRSLRFAGVLCDARRRQRAPGRRRLLLPVILWRLMGQASFLYLVHDHQVLTYAVQFWLPFHSRDSYCS